MRCTITLILYRATYLTCFPSIGVMPYLNKSCHPSKLL